MSKSNGNKNVIVVGGGLTGAALARQLSSKLDASKFSLTLVNAREFTLHMPACIRMTTTSEGNLENSALMPFDKLFINNSGALKIGRVTSISDKEGGGGGEITLASGEVLYYDILVLAPGSHWDGPLSFPDTKEEILVHLEEWRNKFEKANSIVLGGGGAVGVEYAGEIKDMWPSKKVTIVHGNSQLFSEAYPNKFRTRIEKEIRERGVDFVFSDYIDDFSQTGTITTRNGKKIDADLIVPTHGSRPATEFISSLGPDVLNAQGRIKVRKTLQLESHPNIFALGDAIDWAEQKQAAKGPNHVGIIVPNVISSLSNSTPVLKEYKGSPEVILVTNGRNSGLTYFGFLWGIMLGAWFSVWMKSKTLMVPMIRKQHGLDA